MLDDTRGLALASVALIGFVRLSTEHGILATPLGVGDALSVADDGLAPPLARIVAPGPLHAGISGRLLLSAGTGGNLTTDAHIAALDIEHQAEVLTFDRDFARFTGVRYPLLS